MWQKEGKSCGGNPHRSPTRKRGLACASGFHAPSNRANLPDSLSDRKMDGGKMKVGMRTSVHGLPSSRHTPFAVRRSCGTMSQRREFLHNAGQSGRTAPGVCLPLFLPSASTFWPRVTNSVKIRPTPNFYTHHTLKNVHHRFLSGFCKAIPVLLGIAIILLVVKNARNVFQKVVFGPLWPNSRRRPIFMVCHGSIPRWNPPITLLHGGA